jgi:hypothetical protein
MRRQQRRRLILRSLAVAGVMVIAGGLGLGLQIHGSQPSDDVLANRHSRWRRNYHMAQAYKYDNGSDRNHWQHAEKVDDAAPSASPTPVPAPQPATDTPVLPVKLPPVTVTSPTVAGKDLTDPAKKEIAMELVSSAENSSLDWKAQYAYLEDIGDGRGYTGGIIGFCSGTGDMLDLVRYYTKLKAANPLAKFIPALVKVNGSDSHSGLGDGFEAAWKQAAADPTFQKAQNDERDRVYFNPAVKQAKADGLRALGQFIYYDAMVMHGPGDDAVSFGGIRAVAMKQAKTPAQGGDEKTYLNAFLDARVKAMKSEAAHDDVSRVETAQRLVVNAGNFELQGPLSWKMYGDSYAIQ